MLVHKAWPIILRTEKNGRSEVLAFKHPLSGKQLVKDTIERGESPEEAALRELAEESGINKAYISKSLGIIKCSDYQQIWHFFLCESEHLKEHWSFFTEDDGGLEFQFFWHPIDDPVNDGWHPKFLKALEHIKQQLIAKRQM